MIRFTRTSLFFTGLATIFAIYIAYKLVIIASSEKTEGVVERYDISYGYSRYGRTTSVAPVIIYNVNDHAYKFLGSDNEQPPEGASVPIIYLTRDPAVAYVYTFWSYWFHPIIILPIIAWGALVVGVGKKGSYWTFYPTSMRITRTELQRRRDDIE